jgi:hypothetical protein
MVVFMCGNISSWLQVIVAVVGSVDAILLLLLRMIVPERIKRE